MRKSILVLGLVLLPLVANAETPEWALPATQDNVPEATLNAIRDADTAGRDMTYPAMPATVPQIIREGKDGGGVCMGCHLPSGYGAPQSAPLAGLPAAYIVRQLANFASDARGGVYRPQMADFAKAMSLQEIVDVADYYSALPFAPWLEVRETDMVPRTVIGPRDIVARDPAGGEEPIGQRIVEFSTTGMSPYEPGSGPAYMAYVPRGSLARGAELVNRGVGATISCAICHGADLRGAGDVPPIAGRSAMHTARQLFEFRDGTRGGASAQPMVPVAANLNDSDIIAVAAYVASLPPM